MDESTLVSTLAHSELFFNPTRDFWWNSDFIDLMARRWQLAQHRSLLDVGCGQCHWSHLLVPHMAADTQVTALDRDIKWANGSSAIAAAFAMLGATVAFRQGDVQALPFDDNSFDVVTCQTVLMHLDNPLLALQEMRRVVRPGGIVICAEPCNLANIGQIDAMTMDLSIDELCDAFRYGLLCDLGKQAVGEGRLSLGDQLPRLFQLAGLSNIQTYLSDKASPVLPPYQDRETRAFLEEIIAGYEDPRASWWESQVERWITALNDVDAKTFVARIHAEHPKLREKLQALIDASSFWCGGGGLFYLVSAEK